MGKEKVLIVLILILGLGLRLVNLNQSLWLDEAAQAVMSEKSVDEIWSARQADFHPPLFYILAHYWIQVNRLEIWLRLLPVMFGVISIGLIYLLAGRNKFGLLSAFFLAINPYHIYYSQEFRSYSMLAMLGLLSMLFLKQKKYIFMAVTNTLILYTHYSGMFLILAQILIRPITIPYLLVPIALYSPWILKFAEQLRSGVNIDSYLPGWRNVLTLSPAKAIPEIIFKFMAGRINLMPKWIYAIYIIFVLGVTSAGIFLNRLERKFLWVWLGIPILVSFILSFWIPQTQPFRLLYCLPALIMIMAGAATKFPKTFITLMVYISVVGNVLYFTRPRLQREQWRQAIDFMRMQNVTVVVKFFDKFAPFYWYDPNLKVVTSDKVTSDMKKFWYMEYLTGLTDPAKLTQKKLEAGGWKITDTKNFEGVGLIYKYESRN
ncbi:MAG: hypothetical protein AAB768_03350 [Patescibacteria group bacterium]